MADNNPPNPIWPKAPIKCALYSFVVLSVFFSPFLFFIDLRSVWVWPVFYAYCALLSFFWVGLIRNRIHVLAWFAFLALIGLVVGYWGTQLLLDPAENSIKTGTVLLQVAMYLLYFDGALAVVFAIRGWVLYFLKPEQKMELHRGTR